MSSQKECNGLMLMFLIAKLALMKDTELIAQVSLVVFGDLVNLA